MTVCQLAFVAVASVMIFSTDGFPAANTAQSTNTIEILVIVDKIAFDSWKTDLTSETKPEIERIAETEEELGVFIHSVFVGLNSIFTQLNSSGIDLNARIVDIKYIMNETISTDVYNDDHVDSDRVLETFKDWLADKVYPPRDHTLLLTGWNLANGLNTNVLGVAYEGKMCDSTLSLSAVELRRNGNTVLTLAHELGHSWEMCTSKEEVATKPLTDTDSNYFLRAKHDGQGNACPANSEMIMDASRSQNSTDNFKFSSCSLYDIRNFLYQLDDTPTGSCLSAERTTTAEVQGKQLGEMYDPDTVCSMSQGSHSYFGRSFYGPGRQSPEHVCTAIWCFDTGRTFTSVFGTDGFICGDGKRCSLGYCLNNSDAHLQNVVPGCEFGDRATFCSTISQSSCYLNEETCCQSCPQLKTNITGCEYGDKATGCSTLSPSDCYRNEDLCCQFCDQHKTNITGCEYGDRAGWCSTLPLSGCYLNDDVCCQSCEQNKINIPGCEYGDKYHSCERHHCGHPANWDLCCLTCAEEINQSG